MNRKVLLIIIVILIGVLGYVWFSNNYKKESVGGNVPVSTQTKNSIEYVNNQYGFGISLPQDWMGYSVVTNTWEGDAIGPKGNVPTEHGPLILVRNPKWTTQNPYQDIPIMIFTLTQWNSLQQDQFHIGAAPINPSELGRNATYVFALPARYNYAFPLGWEEVQSILDAHPFRFF